MAFAKHELPLTATGCLRLQHELSPYVIEFDPGLAPRLLKEIRAGEKNGLEVGGLLLGSFPRGEALTLRIDDILPINRRVGDGVCYDLSPEQKARLSTARRRMIQDQRPVLGFFRSHLRTEPLQLSSADRDLLANEFRRAIHIALVVRAESPFPAAFFVPDAEGSLEGPPLSALQFNIGDLQSADHPPSGQEPLVLEGDSTESAPPARVLPQPSAEAAPPNVPARGIAIRMPIAASVGLVAACVALLLMLAAGFGGLFSPSRSLGLSVNANEGMLELHWDREQRDLQKAGAALLTIHDGAAERQLTLTPREIRWGMISYQPLNGRVTFRIAVGTGGNTEFAQSVVWSK